MLKRILPLLFCIVFCLPAPGHAIPGYMKLRMGTMSGQVVYEDKPLSNYLVAFFNVEKGLPPIKGQTGRIPDFGAFTDEEGKFAMKLLTGDYYIGVLNRPRDGQPGPPRTGETYYFADGGQGKLRRLYIEDFKDIDYGVISCSPPDVFNETEQGFVLKGFVYNGEESEVPYPNAIVLARKKPTFGRPDYISAPTGKDGSFTLDVQPDTKFYLFARAALSGERPNPGDTIGQYSSSQEAIAVKGPQAGSEGPEITVKFNDAIALEGKKGEVLDGIAIYMYAMPDQGEMQEKYRGTTEGLNFLADNSKQNITFASGSATLTEKAEVELDNWVKVLTDQPDLHVEIRAYADSIGSELSNLELSKQRADAAAAYMIGQGIIPSRITSEGLGEENPVADNHTEEGRSQNRRVELNFR
ncbi:MAG: OmpA family protein [Proteobacteria bacterium]|nr:OmpA family protein [Pseudomonadota bacterium]MBU1738387.1 OmpA family protein [Pseudomonadota bacterium]